jgi:hypothetical protein
MILLFAEQVRHAGTQNSGFWNCTAARGWRHPIHIHFEEGQILNRNGVAPRLIRGSGTQPRCREARARESAVRFAVAHLEKAISI